MNIEEMGIRKQIPDKDGELRQVKIISIERQKVNSTVSL